MICLPSPNARCPVDRLVDLGPLMVGPGDDRVHGFDFGFDADAWLDAMLEAGWRTHSTWGRDGWDVPEWPYVMLLSLVTPSDGCAFAKRIEGDVEVFWFPNESLLWAALDREVDFLWQARGSRAPWVLDPGVERGSPELSGPFSWTRLEASDGRTSCPVERRNGGPR